MYVLTVILFLMANQLPFFIDTSPAKSIYAAMTFKFDNLVDCKTFVKDKVQKLPGKVENPGSLVCKAA